MPRHPTKVMSHCNLLMNTLLLTLRTFNPIYSSTQPDLAAPKKGLGELGEVEGCFVLLLPQTDPAQFTLQLRSARFHPLQEHMSEYTNSRALVDSAHERLYFNLTLQSPRKLKLFAFLQDMNRSAGNYSNKLRRGANF